MQPNTKLRDLLKSKKAKTRKLSELSKIEQNRLAKLNAMLDELRRGKNVQNRQYHQLCILSEENHREPTPSNRPSPLALRLPRV